MFIKRTSLHKSICVLTFAACLIWRQRQSSSLVKLLSHSMTPQIQPCFKEGIAARKLKPSHFKKLSI